jgi:hypothetical protein
MLKPQKRIEQATKIEGNGLAERLKGLLGVSPRARQRLTRLLIEKRTGYECRTTR